VGHLGLGVGVKTNLVTDTENETALMAPYPRWLQYRQYLTRYRLDVTIACVLNKVLKTCVE